MVMYEDPIMFDLVKVRRVESSIENGLRWGKKLLKGGGVKNF